MKEYIDGLVKDLQKEIKFSTSLSKDERKKFRALVKDFKEYSKRLKKTKIDSKTAWDILQKIAIAMEIIQEVSHHIKI